MNNAFLIDLWTDLRAKRMWPVALLLLLALIAVPVVLSKPAEEPAVAPLATPTKAEQTAQVKGLAALKVADDTSGKGSTLDVFNASNPFKPPEDIIKNSNQDTSTTTTEGASVPAGDTGSTGSSSTGIGPSPSTGSGDTTGGGATPSGGTTTTVEYRYGADVTFNPASGKARRIKDLGTLGILPNAQLPLLVFMGASKNGERAVFLVDSTLAAGGDGTCKPSKDKCSFLYLAPGDAEIFSDGNGNAYGLHLHAIRKVVVNTTGKAKKSSTATGASTGTAGETADEDTFVPLLSSGLFSGTGQ